MKIVSFCFFISKVYSKTSFIKHLYSLFLYVIPSLFSILLYAIGHPVNSITKFVSLCLLDKKYFHEYLLMKKY